MFKSGDTIQALEAGTWYDAKIIEVLIKII